MDIVCGETSSHGVVTLLDNPLENHRTAHRILHMGGDARPDVPLERHWTVTWDATNLFPCLPSIFHPRLRKKKVSNGN